MVFYAFSTPNAKMSINGSTIVNPEHSAIVVGSVIDSLNGAIDGSSDDLVSAVLQIVSLFATCKPSLIAAGMPIELVTANNFPGPVFDLFDGKDGRHTATMLHIILYAILSGVEDPKKFLGLPGVLRYKPNAASMLIYDQTAELGLAVSGGRPLCELNAVIAKVAIDQMKASVNKSTTNPLFNLMMVSLLQYLTNKRQPMLANSPLVFANLIDPETKEWTAMGKRAKLNTLLNAEIARFIVLRDEFKGETDYCGVTMSLNPFSPQSFPALSQLTLQLAREADPNQSKQLETKASPALITAMTDVIEGPMTATSADMYLNAGISRKRKR
jgi:hypothetical protein